MNIELVNPFNGRILIPTSNGLTDNGDIIFPNEKGAYRIVKDDNYSENFGYQWNRFAGTQLDKTSHLDISKKRFFAETGWDKEDLLANRPSSAIAWQGAEGAAVGITSPLCGHLRERT